METDRNIHTSQLPTRIELYDSEAYDFVLSGLSYAVEQVHGPMTPAQAVVAQYMATEEIDLHEMFERYEAGLLDPVVSHAVSEVGGPENLNRHVSGQDLSWALRDLALDVWGYLAPAVLHTWGIRKTLDFGHIVFDLIQRGRLQKESDDRLEDFHNVFSFTEAFNGSPNLERDPLGG